MNNSGKKILFLIVLIVTGFSVSSQSLSRLGIVTKPGLSVDKIIFSDSNLVRFSTSRSLYSFNLNKTHHKSDEVTAALTNNRYVQSFENRVKVTSAILEQTKEGIKGEIIFENSGNDTISISNVVPFGEDKGSVYITGNGPWDLARAYLFRPGIRPVRVILPDNAWELGYSSFTEGKNISVCALARRTKAEGGQRQRYETVLPPKTKVTYTFYAEVFEGEWQNGLRLMFRDRYLHDIEKFDNSMFVREDLKWIKQSYLIILQMAWDREFYDRLTGKFNYPDIIKKGNEQFGKIDVYGIWPTWPRLGLDQRNQWDLYSDLPGGITQLKNFAKMSALSGTRFFIAYNPWDNSTRKEDHYKGMARLISDTDADGVVLDTRGASSFELQAAADSVRKGVVMYSEGMAVVKDMPGIISGRVHNAIYLSPELNLNKLIKPDFSIFRVCDVGEDRIHRELAIAFFNGYGTELNMFRPGGRDDNYRSDMDYLAQTTFILRQNNDAFLDNNWTPMVDSKIENVFVNKFVSGDKHIYTVLNMRAEGAYGKLVQIERKPQRHYVSLWNHESIEPVSENGTSYLTVNASGWNPALSGTRGEGSVDCIAEFPELIKADLSGDSLRVGPTGESRTLKIWKGNPGYQTANKEFRILNDSIIIAKDLFGIYEGKIVLQLTEKTLLKDEVVLKLKGGKPWLISKSRPTKRANVLTEGMILIPGATFSYSVSTSEDFMPYPVLITTEIKLDSFLIDRYPVTNSQYYEFLSASGYKPNDTTRYLKNWQAGKFRQGQERYPVVYLSIEDMNAYARWAGKRLPTQSEWQLAAQGTDKRKWPWGDEFHATYCNNSFGRPTPVDAFSKGLSPYGVLDLVGNVWQMTNDMYFNGTNYFSVIRGGSYFKPESSWWYIQGGPQQLDKTQIQLLVSPGFDRSSTVGFRCVKDIDSKGFKDKRQK